MIGRSPQTNTWRSLYTNSQQQWKSCKSGHKSGQVTFTIEIIGRNI